MNTILSCLRCHFFKHNYVYARSNKTFWRDVHRKDVVNNVDVSSLTAQWQNGPHKTNTHNNINWRDLQRKNAVNSVDMSNFRASWQNGPYKNQHTVQHKNT